jgi:hypothetical protein
MRFKDRRPYSHAPQASLRLLNVVEGYDGNAPKESYELRSMDA